MYQGGLLRIGLLCVLWLCLCSVCSAEEKQRLKVGLVLGGGGARGAAHVGVLKVLEELRVPVDAIAGTSMGAIIGGLYATGMSAAEIEQVLSTVNWADAFRNNQPRPDLSFRRKEDDFSFLVDFDLGFRDGRFLLPKGVIYGQKQKRILRALLWPNVRVADFDDLPVPYRAIATDVVTGEMRVMRSGSLGDAIQASMSFPGVFSPMGMGGDLLVDGGISNTLPVDVARQMGMDVLVVVDVSAPLYAADELNTALEITDQVSNVLLRQNAQRKIDSLSERDVLLRPDLAGMGSSDFSRILQAIKPGETAAAGQADRLRVLSLSESAYQQYVLGKAVKRHRGLVKVDEVRVRTTAAISPQVIAARVHVKPEQPLRLLQLEEDIARIYGMQYFERVNADVLEEDGRVCLDIMADRKSWGPNYVNFGIALSDDFSGGSEYNLLARLTRTEVNALAAEWRNDIQIGESPRLASEFYQPLSVDSRYFMASSLLYEQEALDVFEDGRRLAEFRVTSKELDVEIGREFGNWGELRLGVRRGEGVRDLRTGSPGIMPELEVPFEIGQYVLRLRYDQLDNVRFPLSGSRIELDARFSRSELQAPDEFNRYRLGWVHAYTRGRHTFLTRLALGDVGHGASPNPETQFRLGGFLNLSGLSTGELNGPHFALANLVFYRRLGSAEKKLFNMPVYIGGSLEAGNVWQTRAERSSEHVLLAGSMFVGVDTFLGPIYLAAGLMDNGRNALYFSLGRSF